MKISLTNSKLGALIPSLNLPAIITCRKDAPCKHLCYACKGNFKYPNVTKSHLNNYQHFLNNPEDFFNEIKEFLKSPLRIYSFFRWHASGDIISKEYFINMIKIADACPDIKFLAFTKQFEIINEYVKVFGISTIPNNLHIVFSMWDKNFKVENPYNFPTTWVDFKDKSQNPKIPEMAIPCIGKCWQCQSCWSLQQGQSVVFHQH